MVLHSFIVVMICCILLFSEGVAHSANEKNINYDVTDFEILKHRTKRSTLESGVFSTSEHESDLEIAFTSFGNTFHLLLYDDASFQKIPVEAYISDNLTETINVQTRFYEGNLKGLTSNSAVIGFLLDGLLTAQISLENQTYFVEPAKTFLNDSNLDSRKIAVYKDTDLTPQQLKLPKLIPKKVRSWYVKVVYPPKNLHFKVPHKGLDMDKLTEDRYCEMELVADHTWYNFYQFDEKKVTSTLYLLAKAADRTFLKSDFSLNGNPYRIRIAVGKIVIFRSDREGYPMSQTTHMEKYIDALYERVQKPQFCLSYAVFHRQDEDRATGRAARPDERYNFAGGICEMPVTVQNRLKSFNIGVQNTRTSQGGEYPIAVMTQTFTHEVGHNFGSDHDPSDNLNCAPTGNHYVMFPYGANVFTSNSYTFSSCSFKDIRKVLANKGACLKSGAYNSSTLVNRLLLTICYLTVISFYCFPFMRNIFI